MLRLPISTSDDFVNTISPAWMLRKLACPGFPVSPTTDEWLISSVPSGFAIIPCRTWLDRQKRPVRLVARTVFHIILLQPQAPVIFGDAALFTRKSKGPKSLAVFAKGIIMDSATSKIQWEPKKLSLPRDRVVRPVPRAGHVARAHCPRSAPASESAMAHAATDAAGSRGD